MPRPRPPFLHREVTRHGKTKWYVRLSKGPRIRVRETYGTPEFSKAYQAALNGTPSQLAASKTPSKGTLAWLIAQYRASGDWLNGLSHATKRQRENIFKHVLATAGAERADGIKRKAILDGIDRRASTPSQARNFLDAMRGLFRWAAKAEHIKSDPTDGIDTPARPKTEGFPVWTEEDVAKYEALWPVGRRERVWLDVLLYTGLRRGDAVALGRQHVRDGIATLRTEKSQRQIVVTIPILPILQGTLDAGPTGELAFICGANGRPLTKESFGNMFREACRAAGVNKSAHGVRKIGATRAAENGATVAELEAIFGWQGGGMASLYTRAADRARLARGAMTKMLRTPNEQVKPAPNEKVRAPAPKY